MASYKAALVNELEKMFKRKKAIMIIILAVGIIASVQLLSLVLRGGLGIIGSTAAGFPITVLSVFNNTLLPLFTALVVIDAFTGEYANDTLKITVTKPVTRFKIYLAKLSAVGVFILFNLLVVMFLSIVTTLVFSPLTLSLSWLLRIVAAYLVTLFPMLTLAIMIAYPANLLRSSTAVFFLSMIVFLLLRALGLAVSSLSDILVTSLLDWYKLWIASRLPLVSILRLLVVMLAHVLIFFALGFSRFDKRDL